MAVLADLTFFTPHQIAEKLQLNVLTIYSFIKTKQLPAMKIGRHYRISEEDFAAFLQGHKTVI